MDMPDAKGKSYRERLEFGKRQYGANADDLNPELDIPYPMCYYSAYEAWEVMASCRNNADYITLRDILDYQAVYDVRLSESEIEAVFVTDRSFIKYINRKKD